MRLRTVSISRYKNLRGFSLDFVGDDFIDIFVGKNGSGKSNFLEALIEIFDHIYSFKPGAKGPGFDYAISWEIDGKEIGLEWKGGALAANVAGKDYKTLQRATLPANIIVYYSGQNDTVSELIQRYRDGYRQTVRKANVAELLRFIGIGPDYKAMLLALMLMMPEATRARQFLCTKLGIEGVGSNTVLKLRRPGKGIVHRSRAYDPFQDDQLFWGVQGVARLFLDRLMDCITGDFTPGSLYDRHTDTYRLEIDVAKFRDAFAGTPQDEVFCEFNALHTLGMIEEVSIPVRLGAQVEVTSRAFSDGQFQSIYLFAISELFKNRECVTLLDEPDAFLHPEWQYDFLSQVLQISDQAARTNHILMSSHSASTISAKVQTRLRVFEVNGQAVVAAQREKSEIIGSLSAGLISFSEQEAKLNIEQIVGATTKPVLFTEGVSDVAILETAWRKLHPDRQRPFDLVQAFDCGFLRKLLRRQELYRNNPQRKFFALFDFDAGYDEWAAVGNQLPRSIQQSLVCKCPNFEGHALLLPVPDGLSVRNQVWNANINATYGGQSRLTIELLFKDVAGLERYFAVDPGSPAGWYRFVGNKVHFAEQVVPGIAAQHFACFNPMFEYIETTIAVAPPVAAQ
jgi:ABC-type Mn2+/Zn2+ transport system ATPase subunit